MQYFSMTGQFGEQELDSLQSMTAEQLITALVRSDPIVALRAIAEVLMNQDEAKLLQLLNSGELMDHWRGFRSAWDYDDDDERYATAVEVKLNEMRSQAYE